MTNYLLSIDPSMKNTGFTLWEHIYQHCKCFGNCSCNNIDIWKPIWIESFDFKKYDNGKFLNEIEDKITDYCFFDNLDLIIERGTFHTKNGIGYETQEHLRGFIAGQFNKLLTKEMLISPSEWRKWYKKNDLYDFSLFWLHKDSTKWDKEISLELANNLIKENNWNIKVNNHDEADSLLIGWYYLNKENK